MSRRTSNSQSNTTLPINRLDERTKLYLQKLSMSDQFTELIELKKRAIEANDSRLDHLLKIINLLIKALYDDPLMYTDHYTQNQHPQFKENRHEQSLFSLLRKIHGSIVLDGDESFILPFGGQESMKYPFWASRIKG